MSRGLLEKIAQSGNDGIVQPELGAACKMDQRNLFYHLMQLTIHGVVVRLPVASKKAFTYLCILARWIQEEEDALDNLIVASDPNDTAIRPPVPVLMKKITEVLSSAPDQTLPSSSLFQLCGMKGGRSAQKWFRGCIGKLVDGGFLDVILASAVGGSRQPVYRFKRLYDANSAIDLSTSQSQRKTAADSDEEGDEEVVLPTELRPFVSLEKQTRDLIQAAGPNGLVLGDLKKALGITTKCVFKIHQRLTDRKLVSNSDVIKVTEFCGKERRHRLFVEGLASQAVSEVASRSKTPDPTRNTSTPNPKHRQETMTKVIRKQCLMKLLEESKILELSRQLAAQLGDMIKEQSFSDANNHILDPKTLKRVIEQMEQEGLVRSIIVSMPNGQDRVLILPAAMLDDDPLLLERIKIVKDRPKIHDLTRKDQKDTTVVPADEFIRKRQEFFGFIYGSTARTKILHLYLVEKVKPGDQFETPTILFEQLPLGVFLQLVGLCVVSPDLEAFVTDIRNHSIVLKDLPKPIYSELMKRRGMRMRTGLRNLMNNLTDLGLVFPIEDYFSRNMNLRMSISFRLSQIVHVPVPPDAKSSQIITLTNPQDTHRYWALLQTGWKKAAYNEEVVKPVFKAAVHEPSWLLTRPTSHRKQRKQEMQHLAAQLGIASTSSTFEAPGYRTILPKRPISTATAPVPNRKKRKLEKSAPTSAWSDEESAAMSLIFILLHQSPFYNNGSINWILALDILPKRGTTDLRVYTNRVLLADWQTIRDVMYIESKVHLILSLNPLPTDEDDLKHLFIKAYTSVQEQLRSFNTILASAKAATGTVLTSLWLGESESKLLYDWNRVRHYRAPLLNQFTDKPSIIPVSTGPGQASEGIDEDAVNAIKVVMTWPAPKYSATEAGLVLAGFAEPVLTVALNYLLDTAYLTKASGGKHRYRVPGTNYALSSKVASVLLGTSGHTSPLSMSKSKLDTTLVQSFDLLGLLDSCLNNDLRAEFHAETEDYLIDGNIFDQVSSLSSSDLEQHLRNLSLWLVPRRSWFWPLQSTTIDSSFHADLLRNALMLVSSSIDDAPGCTLQSLYTSCHPLLTTVEVDDCVKILTILNKYQEIGSNVHPHINI